MSGAPYDLPFSVYVPTNPRLVGLAHTGTYTPGDAGTQEIAGIIPSGESTFKFLAIQEQGLTSWPLGEDTVQQNFYFRPAGCTGQDPHPISKAADPRTWCGGDFWGDILTTSFITGTGIDPFNATKNNPCGGGHSCNRADFDIVMTTPLETGGRTILTGHLNNMGGRPDGLGPDNGPGPFPFSGTRDRYSSRVMDLDDTTALFGNPTGYSTSTDFNFSLAIQPCSFNTSPHLDITWVRIRNPLGQVIYSCCLGESAGGGNSIFYKAAVQCVDYLNGDLDIDFDHSILD